MKKKLFLFLFYFHFWDIMHLSPGCRRAGLSSAAPAGAGGGAPGITGWGCRAQSPCAIPVPGVPPPIRGTPSRPGAWLVVLYVLPFRPRSSDHPLYVVISHPVWWIYLVTKRPKYNSGVVQIGAKCQRWKKVWSTNPKKQRYLRLFGKKTFSGKLGILAPQTNGSPRYLRTVHLLKRFSSSES